jgi:hypothetical protein
MFRSIVAIIALSVTASANAGFLVGIVDDPTSNNDSDTAISAVIADYNAAHDPDLATNISLFKKSDENSSFVFDSSNGFSFFSDSAGTTPVTSATDLQKLTTAYFTYSGSANLLYYSVKSSTNSELYTYTPGALNPLYVQVNELTHPFKLKAISHVSFWIGPNTVTTFSTAPEPASAMLLLFGGAGAIIARRKLRSKPAELV